ncbi:MAG: helix-turn-helix domain-containing protein [Treponema sp.]|nr:helix-turn-helix domain-containing protein [Treponema sp.]
MDILEKITQMRLEKGWTEYELAERAELTQSTISSWYRKKLIPSIPSLEHICSAFGITLSQFFLDDDCFSEKVSKDQIEILKRWNKLTKEQQKKLADFLDSVF